MPNCIVCSQELLGRKTLYCSPHCRRKNYYLKNKKNAIVCLHGYTLAEGQVIDHINRNKLDCRIVNLRITNFSGNASNKEKTKNKKNSNYKGVHKTKSGKWQTQVWVGGKNLCFGSFETQEEAARKYNEKAIEFFGEFACLNLVE